MTTRYHAFNIIFAGSGLQADAARKRARFRQVDVPATVLDEGVEDFIAGDIEIAAGAQVESFDFMPMKLTRNILNPAAGEIYIPANTPLCCDPGSETYHSM